MKLVDILKENTEHPKNWDEDKKLMEKAVTRAKRFFILLKRGKAYNETYKCDFVWNIISDVGFSYGKDMQKRRFVGRINLNPYGAKYFETPIEIKVIRGENDVINVDRHYGGYRYTTFLNQIQDIFRKEGIDLNQ